jgi:undecaprenyl-diphosphatase
VNFLHSRLFPGAKGILRYDIFYLIVLLMLIVISWSILGISDLVERGRIQRFDEWMLTIFRVPDNPMQLRGPEWLAEFMRDITALGGAPVLTFITLAVAGYLILQKSYRSLGLVLIATVSGLTMSLLLKFYFIRPRPGIVPHLMTETTPSFPSGHSMMSAVVYLTLAALLARIETSNAVRIYTISIAFLIVFLVGISRIFLGVHYPTDILGGWAFGLTWAMACWYIARYLQHQGAIEGQGIESDI